MGAPSNNVNLVVLVLLFVVQFTRAFLEALTMALAQLEGVLVEMTEHHLGRGRMVPTQCSDCETSQSYFGHLMWQEHHDQIESLHHRLRAFQLYNRIRQPVPDPPPIPAAAVQARCRPHGPLQASIETGTQNPTSSICRDDSRQNEVDDSTQITEQVQPVAVVDSPVAVKAGEPCIKSTGGEQSPVGPPQDQPPIGNPDLPEGQHAASGSQSNTDSGFGSTELVPREGPEGATYQEVLNPEGEGHPHDLDPDPGELESSNSGKFYEKG